MIWLLIFIIGTGYAIHRVNRFADELNPHNFSRRNNDI